MRRNTSVSPYLILACCLFCWVSLPPFISDACRSFASASLGPSWDFAKKVRQYLADRPAQFWGRQKEAFSSELLQLQLENHTLRAKLRQAMQWLQSEARLREQMEILKSLPMENGQDWLQKKTSRLLASLQWDWMAIPTQVIYRDPASWSSSLWIDVGEEENRVLGRCVIAKNSPVVVGNALVGVVDYVGNRHARVRLITDSGLCPSVRAVRKDHELAMGEIHGSSSPLWRSRHQVLKGIGFHSDSAQPAPSLQEGDLLVTSGLDGVFPPDLMVGTVIQVTAEKPGGYAFDLEARAAVPHLNAVKTLFVLPPLNDS